MADTNEYKRLDAQFKSLMRTRRGEFPFSRPITPPGEYKAARELMKFLNQNHAVDDRPTCMADGCDAAGTKFCARCKNISYCCTAHQKVDWNKMHKYECFDASTTSAKQLKDIQEGRKEFNQFLAVARVVDKVSDRVMSRGT